MQMFDNNNNNKKNNRNNNNKKNNNNNITYNKNISSNDVGNILVS